MLSYFLKVWKLHENIRLERINLHDFTERLVFKKINATKMVFSNII